MPANCLSESASYPPIDDYALIGDCRSAGLVSRDGSLDWLCLPRYDSPSVFAALLDAKNGGRFLVRPLGEYRTELRYLTNTNVLETVFRTPTGACVLRDLMSVSSEEDKRAHLTPEHEVLRELEGLEGEVEVLYDPRPDYGRVRPLLEERGALRQGREDLRRRGHRRAGPAKAYEIEQRLDEGTQGGPRTGSHVPARGDLTGVGRKPTLAMPLKRNVRRESRCRRHSMHASGGEVGVLFRRVAGSLIRPRSSRGRRRA